MLGWNSASKSSADLVPVTSMFLPFEPFSFFLFFFFSFLSSRAEEAATEADMVLAEGAAAGGARGLRSGGACQRRGCPWLKDMARDLNLI